MARIQESLTQQQSGVEIAPKSLNSANDNGHVSINGIGGRPRFPQGGKHHHHHPQHGFNPHFNHYNGKVQKAPVQAPTKQRVPNADEFPVLAGSITPPSRSPLTGNGPTAAQVLQAPAPTRREVPSFVNGTGKEPSSTRGTTPDRLRSPATSTKVRARN